LQEIRKINEHIVSCLLLATRDVEAYGDNVQTFSTFGEFVLYGKGIEASCGENNDFGKMQHVCDALNFSVRCNSLDIFVIENSGARTIRYGLFSRLIITPISKRPAHTSMS